MADRTPLFPSPSMLIVRRAMVDGLFGDSRVWKVLAFVIIGRRMLQRIMGSEPRDRRRRAHPPRRDADPARGDGSAAEALVRVVLRNPRREIEIEGARTVGALLAELDLDREAHLVICNGTLVPGDARLGDADTVEIRPVISGG